MPGKPVPDLTGDVVGQWTVLGRAPRPAWVVPATRAVYYLCRCTCGTLRAVQGRYLRSGRSARCVNCRNQINCRTGRRRSRPKEPA